MKKFLLLASLWLSVSHAQQAVPDLTKDRAAYPMKARILCLGDSITEGSTAFKGYRPVLAEKLALAGIAVEFVGPKTDKNGLAHGGYSGKSVEGVLSEYRKFHSNFPADVILIHSGHNHRVEEKPIPGIINATEAIIDLARKDNPQVKILLAKVIPAGKLPKYAYIPELNEAIDALGKRLGVTLVDQAEGFVWKKNTIADKVHPNAVGAEKMASKWFAAIKPLLSGAATHAAVNLAADGTATASSELNASYPPGNVIDGVISDTSRWLSADTPEDKWLILTMPKVRDIGGYLLYSGYENGDAVTQVFVEQRQDGKWTLIPSSLVTDNESQELLIRFDQKVLTDALRFVFEEDEVHDGTVRVREIVLWAPGDAPEIGDGPDDPADPDEPVILVNQSGYNTGQPKRFTALGFAAGAEFTVETTAGTPVFQGTLSGQIGDFTEFNPTAEQDFVVKLGESVSDPFRILPYWLERVTYQNAVNFMVDARNYVGNVTKPSRKSYSWRDDHHFAYPLRSLVDQYLSNPAAYTRMPQQITYEAPRDEAWGALTPYNESAPDIVKMIHWGADVIVTQGLTHEMLKSELAYFLYSWPWLEPWLDSQNYAAVKAFAVEHWDDSTADASYPHDQSPSDGHNLFEVKTKLGTTKGAYPPGFSIMPNILMAIVLERERDPAADRFRHAARAQVAWIIKNLDPEDPLVTKGQRMSENILMMSLASFKRLDPQGVPAGFDEFVSRWADAAIRRSENLWDFRKLTDGQKWVPYVEGSRTEWNEPGNVAGFPAAALAAANLLDDPATQARLQQLAWAAFDNMFGRNPVGRHFSYDAPREIEGVERGWFSYHKGGIGQLANARFVLDGAPKDPHYPYHPESGDIGWTEGWVSFNTAFNRALAVAAWHSSRVQIMREGDRIRVVLTAPLNFDYTAPEPVTLIVTTAGGDREAIVLREPEPFARRMEGQLPAIAAADAVPGNGTLELSVGESVRTSYGLGYFEHSAEVTFTD